MADMQMIGAAVAALNGLRQTLVAVLDERDERLRQAAGIALKAELAKAYDAVIATQREMLSMQARIAELERAAATRDDWTAEAARYEKVVLAPGVIAYGLRADAAGGEPMHHLCPRCFGERRKAILQREMTFADGMMCPHCTTSFSVP